MNKNGILVADSGGTGTQWCFVDHNGCKTYFSGRSYHPLYWAEEFVQEELKYWSSKKEMLNAELSFFGAGCLGESNALHMKEILKTLGFSNASVRSDLHAAAFSALRNNNGAFAILGTGSVAAELINGTIQNIVGGLGYVLGDEGSGYYFGKLVIVKLLEGELPDELSGELHRIIGTRQEILQKVYSTDGRAFVAGIAKLTSENDHPVLKEIHRENISMFLNETLKKLDLTKGVSFIGSYAYHNRNILLEELSKSEITCGEIIEKPIERLTEYLLNRPE